MHGFTAPHLFTRTGVPFCHDMPILIFSYNGFEWRIMHAGHRQVKITPEHWSNQAACIEPSVPGLWEETPAMIASTIRCKMMTHVHIVQCR